MQKFKILIACEESQTVCKAFRERGFEAYSCDLQECSGGHPEWHIQGDAIIEAYSGKYDLMIAHPPCERLTCAANKYYLPIYSERFPNIHIEREHSIVFFKKLALAPIKHKAIENPIGIMSRRFKKPSQIIQPFHFGHTERKSTCLWLTNLPKLRHTNIVKPEIIVHKSGKTDSRLHFETLGLPKEERRKIRSKTFQGIADAMAQQWGDFLLSGKLIPQQLEFFATNLF